MNHDFGLCIRNFYQILSPEDFCLIFPNSFIVLHLKFSCEVYVGVYVCLGSGVFLLCSLSVCVCGSAIDPCLNIS